jgi:CDP-archaeol synthase
MHKLLEHLLIVLLPLIITNVSHMLLVKYDGLAFLKTPLWLNAFGENKTWRGFIFIPCFNALCLLIIHYLCLIKIEQPVLLGFTLGFAYVLFELPNSFLKRRLGIKSGESHIQYKLAFNLLDKTDSAFGVAITYFLLGHVNIYIGFQLFLINSFMHIVLSLLLVMLRIKKSF